MLSRAFVICVLVSVALANETKPDKYKNVPGCYISELDVMLPYNGELRSKADCKKYICFEGRVVDTLLCPTPPRNCTLVEHKGQPFPYCCPYCNYE